MKTKTVTATTTTTLLPLLLFFFVALLNKGHALNISTLEEFKEFVSTVNNKTKNYKDETVYLTNDLDFASYPSSSSFEPIGHSVDSYFFRGTFDGQGHVISNLNVASDKFRFMGIFGYSRGTTIRNLVVDDSCSFESDYSGTDGSSIIGGILGQCDSYDGECIIDGCVNMASIKYTGTGGSITYLGGIAGRFTPATHSIFVTNCVNYGDVSNNAPSINSTRIGGITGEIWKDTTVTVNASITNAIRNCVNFGSLTQSGYANNSLYIGGILSVDRPNIIFENCVSLGAITYGESLPKEASIGTISGKSISGNFTNCFWDESLGLNATGSLSSKATEQGGTPSLDLSLFTRGGITLDEISNKTGVEFAVISFNSSGGSVVDPVLVFFTNASKNDPVVLPESEKEGFTFDGWYMDSDFKNMANGTAMMVAGNISFYGRFISTVVKIEFSTKDMSKDEFVKKIEEIADCSDCFTIIEVKEDGNDSGTIIIRFNDVTEAMNFIEVIEK